MPGARMRCTVTIKLSPVRIDEKPAIKIPRPVANHIAVRVSGAIGDIERPARIHAARQHGIHRKAAADHQQIPAQQVDARKRQIPGAIINGRKKLPSVAGIEGIRKKKTMITPCSVNSLL